MDVWGWIAVYAVGLALVQVLLYRYLLNRSDSTAEGQGLFVGDPEEFEYDRVRGHALAGDRGRERLELLPHDERRRLSGVAPGEGRPCPRCGAENEPDDTFTRCWNCAGPL